ncbi:hypothetical protein LWC33_24020 [Pseudonocardia sp. RS11V-5]|nr:hypothetical protein [Pseudonocardia terrae]MCE3554512.1 hypothetical protein [Pseudonocardia terrae]
MAEALKDVRADDIDGQPGFRFWLMESNRDLVAVLDTDGWLHYLDRSAIDIYRSYRRTGSLTTTLGETLGHLLS